MFIKHLEKLKTINTEENDSFVGIAEAIKGLLDETKISTKDRIIDKVKTIGEFVLEETPVKYNYILIKKVLETFRLQQEPIVFMTIAKNTLGTEPDYNLVPKILTNKGYNIPKLLSILFNNNDSLHETILTIQLLLQNKLDIIGFMDLIVRQSFIDYITVTEYKSNKWINNFKETDMEFNELIDYCVTYINET